MAKHNDLGKAGEKLAREYLSARGFTIVKTNWRCFGSEIDIIAGNGKITIFAEVKTRSLGNQSNLAHDIHEAQLRRLARAFENYIIRQNIIEWRFFVFCVNSNGKKYSLNVMDLTESLELL